MSRNSRSSVAGRGDTTQAEPPVARPRSAIGGNKTVRHTPRPANAFVSGLLFAYTIVGITVYEGAMTEFFRYLRGGEHRLAGESEITFTLSQIVILCGLLIHFVKYRNEFGRVCRNVLPYILIVGLCEVSSLWSHLPLSTARKSVTLGVCIFFGVWCYRTYGLHRLLLLVSRVTVVLGALSAITYFALPVVGRETALGYESAMRGVFSQKNTCGEAMLLGISACIYEMMSVRTTWRKPLAMAFLLLFFEMMARAATCVIISLAMISLGIVGLTQHRWRFQTAFIFTVTAGFVMITGLLLMDSAAIFALIGRDPSFTGRVPLWMMSTEAVLAKSMLGYGYGAFWDLDFVTTQYIWKMINWEAPSAHNGYLDIALQIGGVGLGLYVWMWSSVIGSAWRLRTTSVRPEAIWILLFMFVNVVLNMDEGPLPYPDQFTLLMSASMVFLADVRRTAPDSKIIPLERRYTGIGPTRQRALGVRSSV